MESFLNLCRMKQKKNDRKNCKVHEPRSVQVAQMMYENQVFLPGDKAKKTLTSENQEETFSFACIAVEFPISPYGMKCCGADRIYKPECGHVVLGVITKATSAHYSVNIEAAFEALLPVTSFNQTTKQNRPRLKTGNLILARVVDCFNHRLRVQVKDHLNSEILQSPGNFSQAKLSCVDLNDSHSWSSGKVYFGEISNAEEGYSFLIPLSLAVSLQADDCYILDRLGSLLPFEIAVGLNGRVWVKGATVMGTLIVQQVLKKACGLSLPQIEHLIITAQNCYTNAKISPQV